MAELQIWIKQIYDHMNYGPVFPALLIICHKYSFESQKQEASLKMEQIIFCSLRVKYFINKYLSDIPQHFKNIFSGNLSLKF